MLRQIATLRKGTFFFLRYGACRLLHLKVQFALYIYLCRLAVNNFTQEANNATIEFSGDNEQSMKLQKQIKKWDRKKKKMVTVNNVSVFLYKTVRGTN